MSNPPQGMQRVIPYVAYRNAPAAIEFLCRAFGFEERSRLPMPDGRIGHAELSYGENVFMLASAYPEFGLVSPQDLPAQHAQIKCYVDDVDAHYERACAAGATVLGAPDDHYGERSYRAMDLEGHRWMFSTADVAPPSKPGESGKQPKRRKQPA